MRSRKHPLGLLCAALGALLFTAGCGSGEPRSSGAPQSESPSSELSELMSAAMDRSVDPCQDFYRYACGGWLATTRLSPNETRKVRNFSMAAELNADRLEAVMQEALNDESGDMDAQRVKAMFGACIDEAAIEEAGTAPLEPYFDALDAIVDLETLMSVFGRLQRDGIAPFFNTGTFVLPDGTAFILDQMSFPLKEKDAYLRDDAASVSTRNAYIAHIARMLELTGDAPDVARASAQTVLALETELAKGALAPAELRDLLNLYHPTKLEDLEKSMPTIPWGAFFDALGLPGLTATINVTAPRYYEGLGGLLGSASFADLQTYLRWFIVHANAQDLPRAFREADFEFFERALTGREEPESRRKICADRTRSLIPDSVSRGYVKRFFPEESRRAATSMLESVKAAFRDELGTLDWLSDATRQWAVDKTVAMGAQIGHPDVWEKYDGLALSPRESLRNSRSAARFGIEKTLSFLGKAADPAAWPWDAATVNAQYRQTTNAMNLPAGVLQPPFYSPDYPPSVNHGGIGFTMGHELTHGFDDQGRIFGADGVPGTFWSEDEIAEFNRRAACVREQFDGYEVQPGLFVDGALTLGENIADLGGVKLSLRALQSRKGSKHFEPVIDGLRDEQVFFVAYAQTWCEAITEEQQRQRVLTDPHSPNRFRVIGSLSNLEEFADAFECKPGDPMVRTNRCEVW